MATLQTGVLGDHAAHLAGLVPRFDIGTAPTLLRSTMAQTAWDLGTTHKHATQDRAQVREKD